MALATTTTPGSVILGGDLTGVANAPELRVTGVTAGTYTYPTIVVDAKGRLIYANGNELSGEVTGVQSGLTINTTLIESGVTTGTYSLPALTVDAKGRVTLAESQVLAGDISGPYTATVLATVPGAAGTYTHATVTVDAKGRVTSGSSGSNTLSGEVTGTLTTSVIGNTTVTAGTYSLASMTIRADGRLSSASTNVGIPFSGDVSGTSNALTLNDFGASAGTFNAAIMTIDSKGRVSSASNGTSVAFSGQLSGTIGATSLTTVGGLFTGSYTYATITVGNKGLISAISNNTYTSPPDATASVSGLIQISSGTGLAVSAGSLSVGLASGASVYGVVNSANTSNITLSSGQLDIGADIPSLLTTPTFSKAQNFPTLRISGTVSPNTDDYDIFVAGGYINPLLPTNIADGTTFSLIGKSTNVQMQGDAPLIFGLVYSDVVWNGTVWCAVSVYSDGTPSNLAITSPDGLVWTTRTLPSAQRWSGIAWNGTVFCAVGDETAGATSPDGITWTSRTLPAMTVGAATAAWVDIAWNGTVFCAVGNQMGPVGAGPRVATSPDGITWTVQTVSTPSPYTVDTYSKSTSVVCGGSQIVIFYGWDKLSGHANGFPVSHYSSDNGVTWWRQDMDTTVEVPSNFTLGKPAWNGAQYVVFSNNYLRYYRWNGSASWASFDGGFTATPLDVVAANGTKLYAFGDTRIYLSTNDGLSWTSEAEITTSFISDWFGTVHGVGTNGTDMVIAGYSFNAYSLALTVKDYSHYIATNSNYKLSNTIPNGNFTLNCVVMDSIVYGTYSD